MEIHTAYKFVATTAGYDQIDGACTAYIGDGTGGPYFLIQRSTSENLPQPEDLYLEYGDQKTGTYGSLKRLTLTRSRLNAFIDGGTSIEAELQITDENWKSLEGGVERLLEGLEPFILRH